MRFEEKYWYLTPDSPETDGLIVAKTPHTCCICGRPTRFIEINYEDAFCSDECVEKLEVGLMDATHE